MKTCHTAVLAASMAMAAALPAPAFAAAELQTLREELQRIKESYEQRIGALEKRLAQAESAGGGAAVNGRGTARLAAGGEGVFNPAISLVLGGTYTRLSQDPNSYQIQGFVPSGGEVGPPRRSFGLGESELSISANIDPTWRGTLTMAVAPEGGSVEVEEAQIRTLGLGNGLSLKAGRFLSGIGYLNEQHAHAWNFSDAPLAYKAFLGNQLKNDGVQVKWLAPTDMYLELGAEAASGGAFPSSDRNQNGVSLTTLFAHLGDDVGGSHSWRGGLSLLSTSPRDRAYADVDAGGAAVSNGFSGTSRTWIADFIWKWAPNGNASETSFSFLSEYLRRRESGQLAFNSGSALVPYESKQSGFYAQGVYKFMPRWRAGYRYDRLEPGTPSLGLSAGLSAADFPLLARAKPRRHTLMVDYAASEFSLLRMQLARDQSRAGISDNQFWLQYVVSLGAHGAHRF